MGPPIPYIVHYLRPGSKWLWSKAVCVYIFFLNCICYLFKELGHLGTQLVIVLVPVNVSYKDELDQQERRPRAVDLLLGVDERL